MKHIVLAWCLVFSACALGADRQPLQLAYGYSTADTTAQSGVFASAFQRFLRQDTKGVRSGTIKSQPTAIALGYRFAKNNWFAGLSASFEHATRKYDFSSDYLKVRDKTYGATVFAGIKLDAGLYAKGSFFLGHHDTKAKRTTTSGVRLDPSSSDNGTRVAASVELGWLFCTPAGWQIAPHAGVEYAHAPTERYSARDPFVAGNPVAAVWIADNHNYWEIPVGIAVGKTFAFRNWTLTPQADATLVMAPGSFGPYHTGFASRTGDGWKVHGIGSDGHWGTRLKAGVQAKYTDRVNVGLEYAFEARKRLQDHRISATVGWAF